MAQTLNVARHVVGCVPYINARPLVRQFADTHEVDVIYDVPSKLPALLDSGKVEAILASAYDAISRPGRTYAAGVSVGSRGPVQSVKLFSKVPFAQIGSLALDASSLTSNALARALLAEIYNARPDVTRAQPSLREMLIENDAAVLIGDKGMAASGEGLRVLDLGDAWTDYSKGLPFVWAIWIGTDSLSQELAEKLERAARWGEKNSELIARESSVETGLPYDVCLNYLSKVMDHGLWTSHLRGLEAYRDLLLKHGLLKEKMFPRQVAANGATVA